jgi:hypothetical protein
MMRGLKITMAVFGAILAIEGILDMTLPVQRAAGMALGECASHPQLPIEILGATWCWRLPSIGAPAEIVFEGFVHRLLEYHKEWTREFAGGRVVEQLGPSARILYQRFQPGIPGIAARDLCSIEVVRDLAPGVKLASFRSVDRLPACSGAERIDWWGAALCTTHEGGKSSELVYLDRENQGGWFPAWLMNRMMTRYLVLQAEQVRRFFATGGPPELRLPRA